MKVSTRGRYGLLLMIELAHQFGRGPVLVGTIAERHELPAKYLHVLMGSLKAAGLVKVLRGPSGGCELARHPSRITALAVLESLEGSLEQGAVGEGSGAGARIVGLLLAQSSEAFRVVLAHWSLADLAEKQHSLEAGSHGYSI